MSHHHHGEHRCHDHEHGHGHHAPADFGRAFAIGTALNIGFAAIELGYGFFAHSLALVADAAHNFSDVVGLLMAWAGHALGKWAPTKTHTYGFRRASILAGIANAVMLLGATGFIIIEAIRRFITPQDITTSTVVIVAVIGILLNGATALLFMRGRKDDINIQGAFLHMAADAGVSLGVVVGALLIAATGLLWIDPLVSLAIAAVILWSSWGLAAKALNLAMDAVPHNIDRDGIADYLAALPGVTDIHDLHIWAMGTTENALTVHLVRPDAPLDDFFIQSTCVTLRAEYNIQHATLQIESGRMDCSLACDHAV